MLICSNWSLYEFGSLAVCKLQRQTNETLRDWMVLHDKTVESNVRPVYALISLSLEMI